MIKVRVFDVISYGIKPQLEPSKVGIYRTPQPVDEFRAEVVKQPDKSVSVRYVSDLKMFFNQQRLNQLSPQYIQQMLQSARKSDNSFGLSDEQLIAGLKSRYIQSNADMYAYTRWLNDNIDSVVKDIADKQKAIQEYEEQQRQQQQQQVQQTASSE